jgi:hypothetical protein
MSAHATTGTNNVDNVEQVLIAAPGQAGTWQIVITHKGSLTNNRQDFSLLLDGVAGDPAILALSSISPATGDKDTVISVDITGNALSANTSIKLQKSGEPDIHGTSVQMIGATLRCTLNLSGAAGGGWDVVATNPDLQTCDSLWRLYDPAFACRRTGYGGAHLDHKRESALVPPADHDTRWRGRRAKWRDYAQPVQLG